MDLSLYWQVKYAYLDTLESNEFKLDYEQQESDIDFLIEKIWQSFDDNMRYIVGREINKKEIK